MRYLGILCFVLVVAGCGNTPPVPPIPSPVPSGIPTLPIPSIIPTVAATPTPSAMPTLGPTPQPHEVQLHCNSFSLSADKSVMCGAGKCDALIGDKFCDKTGCTCTGS